MLIQVGLLSFLLAISAIVHLMDPFYYVNAIPLFIPFKLEVIFVTGLAEIVLSVGILIKRFRKAFLQITLIYFLILLPMAFFHHWVGFLLQFMLLLWVNRLRKH